LELLVMRDLIKDDLGNYYVIQAINGNKLTLVNAVIYNSFKRILSYDFVDEVEKKYGKPVAVGQYFLDALKSRIEGLESGKYPGGIYTLEEVAKNYEIEVNTFYERDVNL
jgi:hypothetical protein